MKIAVYSGNIPSTTFIENLIEGLSENGFEILLFGKKGKKVKYNSNVKLFPTPGSNAGLLFFLLKESLTMLITNPKLFLKSVSKIYRRKKSFPDFLKEAGILFPVLNHQPDVFHIQWAKTIERFPELFELLKCKIALSLRGAHINYSPIADKNLAESYKKYFPEVDGFHAVSEAISIEAQKYNADKKRIKVIHTSVSKDLLMRSSLLYNGEKKIEIISVGRFHWKKGYHYALDSLRTLADEGIDFNYTLIAQGEVPEEIIFLIDEYKFTDKVKIIQNADHDMLVKLLTESHILLLPSVEEGIANVVLEAMAAGVPVITTDCGGMNEAVKDNFNGYVTPVRTTERMSEKIKEFINSDSEKKKILVSNAKQTIKENFSREKQIQGFSDFYKTMIQ